MMPVKKNSIKYRGLRSWKYQVRNDYKVNTPVIGFTHKSMFLELDNDGLLTVKHGYCWDGPSGPTWDSKNAMRGSLVHDAFYQMMRNGIVPQKWRPIVDELFHTMIVEDKMGGFRAWYFHRAVRMFGGKAAAKKAQLPDRQAP